MAPIKSSIPPIIDSKLWSISGNQVLYVIIAIKIGCNEEIINALIRSVNKVLIMMYLNDMVANIPKIKNWLWSCPCNKIIPIIDEIIHQIFANNEVAKSLLDVHNVFFPVILLSIKVSMLTIIKAKVINVINWNEGTFIITFGIVITNNVDMYDSKMIVPAEGKANKCLYLLWRLSVAFKEKL